MIHSRITASAVLMAIWAGAGLWLAPAPAADQPASRPAAAKRPQTAPATQPAPDDDDIPLELIRVARQSFVTAEVWYKKDITDSADVQEKDWRVQRIYEEFIARRCPEEMPALVLDDQAHVLITDDGTEKRFIDRIVIRDAAGRSWPAQRERMLLRAPGVILKLSAESAKHLKPLQFVDFQGKGINARLLEASLYRRDDQWQLRVVPISPSIRFDDDRSDNVYFGYRNVALGYGPRGMADYGLPAILADCGGKPVGCALSTSFDLDQGECAWRSKDICKGQAITFAELDKMEADLERKLTGAAHEVVFTLRQSSMQLPVDPGAAGNMRMGGFGRSMGTAAGQELTLYGVAISPTDVLVPYPLDRKIAAQADKIFVKLPDGERRAMDFVGAYKDFGAFVLRLSKGKFASFAQLAGPKADLPAMQPFWAAAVGKRFGQKEVRLTTNRLIGKLRGYGGKFYDSPANEMPGGALLVDMKGCIAGINLTERIEDEEERQFQTDGRYFRPRNDFRVFRISELHAALVQPTAFLDPKIQVKTRSQAKRRAWFGVEFVPISPDLAEQLKVEQPTKDGKLGFLVNAVYDGSPAQKLGVQVGDILLRLQAEGTPYPIDLAAGRSYSDMDVGGRWGGGDLEGEEGEGFLVPTWKSRENFLTRALDAIGAGRKVKITCCRGETGQVRTIDYTVQQAPPDLDSAPRWKNQKLGLTVKDMTYEVRYALNLSPTSPGVVLAKVERGSPVLVAKVFPFEVITRVDDKPLTTARQMRDLIAQAHQAGQKTVRLTVLRLGKTRFADLSITAYDPADDEGLDGE